MGIKTSKLNCGGKGAKEEPYRSRSVTVKNVVKKTRVENGGKWEFSSFIETETEKLKVVWRAPVK